MKVLPWELTDRQIAKIVDTVLGCAAEERWDDAWREAQTLVKAHARQERAARALVQLLGECAFDRPRSAELAASLFENHSENVVLVGAIGQSFDTIHDIRYLNAAPPELPFLRDVAGRLRELSATAETREEVLAALYGLAAAARLLGRTWDDVAESACLRLVELCPERWPCRYDLGLFYKTRGRFAEGQAANQAAADLGGAQDESVLWNLGICATGAGHGDTAMRLWTGMGQKLEMGRFGLPEGSWAPVKVRLAERPLAERDPAKEPDDPGLEETIWVERLSPCHGIVRSALYYDEIGVDYGDVVLFDGAPITYHTYGDGSVAVFPHLTTLVRDRYQIYRFGGTQGAKGQIAGLSRSLEDVVLYVHTEQVSHVCLTCWENPGIDHADHRSVEHHVVTGKLCAPASMGPAALLGVLDPLQSEDSGVRLYVPELSRSAGDAWRAEVETRRLNMLLRGSLPGS
jgi:hypothetical protein